MLFGTVMGLQGQVSMRRTLSKSRAIRLARLRHRSKPLWQLFIGLAGRPELALFASSSISIPLTVQVPLTPRHLLKWSVRQACGQNAISIC